jgi:orotate phosphoribosyltransferase
MTILFETKFTSKDLSPYINNYYEKSMNESEVIFSMKKLEWIAVEELTFLFGWIRNVKFNNKKLEKIFVELPTTSQTEPEIFKDEKEKNETIRRRRTRLISLVENWKMIDACGLNKSEINVDSDLNLYLGKSHLADNNWHSIIPFKAIPFVNYHSYNELRENIKSEVEKKFKLLYRTEKLLEKHTTKSIFDNNTLSNIITTELYLNSLHHSFNYDNEIKNKECYFSISLRNKININKYIETKKNEGIILTKSDAEAVIQKILFSNSESERIKIERNYFKNENTNQFKNDTFIEFSFLDFGEGIPSTLRTKYKEELSDEVRKDYLKQQLSDKHFDITKLGSVHEDSLILEYAFLLHSSSNPFSKQLQINDYVPRGLFFLIDMVKRYNGMVVVRSNKGCISYLFDDNSKPTKNCIRYSEDENDYYPGTVISIYIPAELKDKLVKVNAVERLLTKSNTSQKREIKYIGISDILKESNQNQEFNSRLQINNYYDKTFEILNYSLDKFNQEPTLILVDFVGCDSSIIDHKIYYYLSNTPKINTNTTLVIINGTDKNVIKEVQKSIITSDDLLFRPIPCIISKKEVIWIGIKNINDEQLLNKLWQYADVEGGYFEATSEFKNIDQLMGNVIKINWVAIDKNQGNVSVFIPSKDRIFEYYSYDYCPKQYLKKILFKEEKHKVLKKAEDIVYWTSGGYYQTEFIRFIEKLYEVELVSQATTKYAYDFDFGKRVADFLIRKYELLNGELHFDYIVSVTLSSQLLANFVKDIYSKIKELSKGDEPKIIRLANYYEFTTEKAFKKIEKGKKVLIVNDVISTGKLSNDIYKSLVAEKEANVVGIFSLIDSRQPKNEKWEINHYYEDSIEAKTIWLLKHSVKKYSNYKTINKKYETEKPKIISIDPVINTPNTMSYQRSDTDRLIYSDSTSDSLFDSKNFLKKFEDPNRLWVGHLHHNVAHHSYYFRLHKWFETVSGKELIKTLINAIKNTYKAKSFQIEKSKRRKNVLSFIEDELKTFENYFSTDEKMKSQYQSVIKELNILEELAGNNTPLSSIETDIIFYPMYSGTEVFNRDDYRDIFEIKENSKFILFPLGRVDTPKGWRFTFPPKVLNEITQSFKNVFIIDDGTCTGETLMQTIDSVAFLNVNRITVLSVVGRLEDFQREFFTRLHSIKVRYEQVSKSDLNEIEVEDRVVPLNIYFGVHFHIQVYPAFTDVCPFCEEERNLKKEKESSNFPPEMVKLYIEKRLKEIELYDTDGDLYDKHPNSIITFKGLPSYIPQDIDRFKLFEYRDKIGKLASYRTFKEYLELEIGDWEIWIAILLHEPKLKKIIDQLLPSLKNELADSINNLILKNKLSDLNYSWRVSDLIRFYSIIKGSYIFEYDNIKAIIKFASANSKPQVGNEDDFEQTLQYLRYFVWSLLKFHEKNDKGLSIENIILSIEKFWVEDIFPNEEKLKKNLKNKILLTYFKDIIRNIEVERKIPKLPQYSFTHLKKFYLDTQANSETHARGFVNEFNNIILDFQSLRNSFQRNNNIQQNNWEEKIISLKIISKKFNESILNYINVSKEVLKDTTIFDKYISSEKGIFEISKKIDTVINKTDFGSLSTGLLSSLVDDIQYLGTNFIFASSPLSKFFTKHDAEIQSSFIRSLNLFHERYSSEIEKYKINPEISGFEHIPFKHVNLHPDSLEIIFRNIFDNIINQIRIQYPLLESCPEMKVGFNISHDDNNIIICHYQNTKNSNGGGLGLNEIKAIIEFFGGSVEASKQSEDFVLTMKFPVSNNLKYHEE